MPDVSRGNFVHLHCHSHYSLLDGLSKIKDLVARAKELGMPALALTDHGNMHGAIEFYTTCKEAGIKPIIGVEAYMAERSRHDKEANLDSKRYHLTLLARNTTGYKNLMKLVSRAYLEGYYYKPRMDEELLREHNEGLICLTGCPSSRFIRSIRDDKMDEARRLIDLYIELYGKEHVFIEVMKHDEVDWYIPLIPAIIELAKEYDLPIVGTWDSHYLRQEDSRAHNTLLAINTNNQNFKFEGTYHFIDSIEADEVFQGIPGAVANTLKVAELVDIEIDLENWYFPKYELPEGTTADEALREMTYRGIDERADVEKTPDVEERINYELEVIATKDYSSYFLVVADLMRFARDSGILGNVRGSAAGSLVSYLIGITNINPLSYDLIFERFLNPERPSLPDVDMDFADDRRDEVIEYTRTKYGRNAVAQIGTFGTMLARGSVRDVARALGHPYSTGDQIAKLIPLGAQGFPMTIDRAIEMTPELADLYAKDTIAKEVIDLAKKIEGCARHVSVHAAGVVISPTGDVTDFSPVQLDPKGGKIITQYDMYTGHREGVTNLPKFDFLGLRNLTILADALKRVETIRGIEIDIDAIPTNDTKTFEMMSRGETMGVFQFAGSGMQKTLRDMKPGHIDDLIAAVALYRPGPMAFIPEYIQRKENPRAVKFLHPALEPILERTYGIIIYQEDILLIATKLAGYTWLEADKFRKAVGKKIPEEMVKQKKKFIDGVVAFGMKDKVANELWDQIETFAAYGFNKAHAASYALLAYKTAYMKAHYPAEYMSAILTAESGNLDKVSETMNECKRMGYEILPPEVNESFSNFTVVVEDGKITNKIRFGLRSIKNFGEEIGKAIIHERKRRGPYTSIEDFLERVQHSNLNKKSLEALIMCGAMDAFGERGQLLSNLEHLLSFNREIGKTGSGMQDSLFGSSDEIAPHVHLEPAPEASKEDRLAWERELLGLYVSGHPLDRFRDRFEKASMNIKKLKEHGRVGSNLVIGGIIEEVKEVITKKNDRMAFVTISDFTDSVECVVFPGTYATVREKLEKEKTVAIKGKLNERNGDRSLIIENVKELTD